MSAKYMRVKKIVLSVLTVAILVSQLSGCAFFKKDELVELIKSGETIMCEVVLPDWSTVNIGDQYIHDWIQLDQLRTYTTSGFRSGFDKLFNINIITLEDGNSKQGCIYVIKVDDKEIQSGNTSMRDAFRNKKFMEYMNSNNVKNEIVKLADDVYLDIDSTSKSAKLAVLNAYFNIAAEENADQTYEPNRSLTREQFWSLVYRASNGVTELDYNGINDEFAAVLGINTIYTPFAKELHKYGYLDINNGSLNTANISTAITKYEALYTVVNMFFSDYVNNLDVSGAKTAFGVKNAGNLAEEIGAIVGADVKPEKVWTPSEAWQLNTLGYMLKNPDKGMDQSLFKHMVAAEKLGLANGWSGGLTDPITKNEAMQLMLNVFNAENNVYGYLTTSEYAEISEINQPPVEEAPVQTPNVPIDSIVIDELSELTLNNLTAEQLKIFDDTYNKYAELVGIADSVRLVGEKEDISRKVNTGLLPINGTNLYVEWRNANHPVLDLPPVETSPITNQTGAPIPDQTDDGPDESNIIRDQQAEQARQETAGKFTYPPGTSTKGLSERDIKQGVYYEIATGNKYDQEGNFRGKYAGAIYDDLTMSDEEGQAALEKNLENAEKIYDGTGEGSDTSNFN